MDPKQLYVEKHHHLDEALYALGTLRSHVLRALDVEERMPAPETEAYLTILAKASALFESLATEMAAIQPLTR